MRYIKDGAVAADPWVYIVGDEPVPPDVPYENFLCYLDVKRKVIEG